MGIQSAIGKHQNLKGRVAPGGPVVKTSPSNVGDVLQSLVGEQRLYIPPGQKKNQNVKQKQYCNKFSKDFKNGPYPPKKTFKKTH